MSRLWELRKERGLTQVRMQMLTGIDQSDYSKIERGQRYYTFEQCRRIALALETSMDYFLLDTPYARPDAIIETEIAQKLRGCSAETLIAVNQMIDVLSEQEMRLQKED